MKQGGWGGEKLETTSTMPASVRNSGLPSIGTRLEQNLIKLENFEQQSRTNEPIFDKNELYERNLIAPVSPETVRYVETEGPAANLNEYQSESQDKLDQIKTIMISNTQNQAQYARNSSNVSVDTDRTRKHKHHESGLQSGAVSKHQQYQSFQQPPGHAANDSDPDRLTTGMLNITMNIESSKNLPVMQSTSLVQKLTKERYNNNSSVEQSQADQLAGLRQSLNEKSIASLQQIKPSKYASIDNLKQILEREERQEFFQSYTSKGNISQSIDEKALIRRHRGHIEVSTQELQAKIKARKKEIEAKRREQEEFIAVQEHQIEMYQKLCGIINMSSMQFR